MESDMARKEESRKTIAAEGKRGQAAKGTDLHRESSRVQGSSNPAGVFTSQAERSQGRGGTATLAAITHERIAERARQIWEQHGCPQGEDERNWREAERQLKKELGVG